MILMVLIGACVGAALGFLASVLCTMAHESEIRSACHACHRKHMDAMLRAGVDTRFAERWER